MTEIKKLDLDGKKALGQSEGLRLKPYLDTQGIPTIGIGCTYYENGKRVTMKDPAITLARAYQLFDNVVQPYEMTVWSITRDDLTQNEFNALVSFCFNVGVAGFKGSTLLKRVNARDTDKRIYDAFMMWTKNKELIGRRKREANHFINNTVG